MEVWKIVDELERIYSWHWCDCLLNITTDHFQYISDYEDISPLNREQYQEYLEKQLKNFDPPHFLEITKTRCCKYLIELVLQKDTSTHAPSIYEVKPDFHPFMEPRLLQCEIENGKISKMHLCSPDNQRIPDNIQTILLESCKNNDFNAAQKAIEAGAYAGICKDDSRSCLEYAAESGSAELCRLLVEDEAGGMYDGFDWRIIFYAVQNPDLEVLKYFLTLDDITLDFVFDFAENDIPMTVLDYARYLNNQPAVEILQKINAPTFQELKDWCFSKAKLKIRISEKSMDGGDMSIGGVCEEVNEYAGLHCGNSEMSLWMSLEDCCRFIIPFFLEYFTRPFEEYLEDNLVTFENAEKALIEIHKFSVLLDNDFDNPAVQKILDGIFLSRYIDWERQCNSITSYFSSAEKEQLLKAKKQFLIDFYQEFCQKLETLLIKAKEAGDCYISFVGP